MTRVEEIEAEIEKLSQDELGELRDWLLERETAQAFLERRAANASPGDLLELARKAGQEPPSEADRR